MNLSPQSYGTIIRGCLAFALILITPRLSRADWPAFLGGSERYEQSVSIPTKWSPEENVKWTADLPGHGQSSPVVIGNQVYLTAVEGPNKEENIVACYSLSSGEQLWAYRFENSLQVENNVYTSRAAPTPAADSQGVYAFFESGDFVALTPEGTLRWQRDFASDYGKIEGRFGLGGSVASFEDQLYVLCDNEGPSYLLALNKSTGKTNWKTARSSRVAWSSPAVLPVDGKMQVVVSSAGPIDGYDAADGSLIWSVDGVGGNTVASPIPFGDGRFLVGASPGRNGENSDGAKKSNMAVQVTKTDTGYDAKVLWRNEDVTSSFGSPIVYRERAYYVNRAGGLFCLNANTGELLFQKRMSESIWATPLGCGDHVYFFGQKGDTTVIAASDEFDSVSVNRLYKSQGGGGPGGFNAEIQYGVALSSEGLLIRTGEHLFLVGAK